MSVPNRRFRCLALVLLLCALAAPTAGVGSDADPCCVGMSEPCAPEQATCAALSATPCCSAAPVTAWPTAQQRESGQQPPAQALGAALVAVALGSIDTTPAPAPSVRASLVRRSVVLRL
jgi:hypothetical protein